MNAEPRIAAIIPARYASTRLAAKALIDLCGKPMIERVYERVVRAKLVREVVVATDDERIAEVVHGFGGTAIMTPASLRSGSDRIAFAAAQLTSAEIIVNVQGDEPLIHPSMIDAAIEPLLHDASVQVGTLVKRIVAPDDLHNPSIVKVVLDGNADALYFSRSPIPYVRDEGDIRRWSIRHVYFKHIGLYVYRKDVLLKFASWPESALERAEKLEQLRIIEHGYKIRTTLTELDTIPVDTAEDAERVRVYMQEHSEESDNG